LSYLPKAEVLTVTVIGNLEESLHQLNQAKSSRANFGTQFLHLRRPRYFPIYKAVVGRLQKCCLPRLAGLFAHL